MDQAARWAQIGGITVPPLVLAAFGLTHPATLTDETAAWWRDLHVLLLPVFPLLGVNIWWLLAGVGGAAAWLARVAAFLYMAFYGALDVLAGIGAGAVRARAAGEGRREALAAERWLFDQGNALAEVGVWAFLAACALTSALLVARHGRRALPGAVLLCAAALPFLREHIYPPVGVATMVSFAAAFGLVQWARLRPRPT